MKNAQPLVQWESLAQPHLTVLRLSGELSRDTLLPLWSQRDTFLSAALNAARPIQWDLSKLQRIDSAGFAFLCELLHYCQSKCEGQKVSLANAPAQLFTLSDLFGLSSWIKSFLFSSANSME